MSDTSKPGPTLSSTVSEVQGIFPSDAALQTAIADLTRAGFDRAEFSLPHVTNAEGEATPNASAEDPDTVDDRSQIRNMNTSMAAAAAGMVGAGVVVATGGIAAVAVAAAVGAGALAGGGVHALHTAEFDGQAEDRNLAASRGELVLAVHTTTDERRDRATEILRGAGASQIVPVSRTNSEITPSS